MLSAQALSDDTRYPAHNSAREPAFTPSFRPARSSAFRSGGEWSLAAPSDVDLDEEQQLSAAFRHNDSRDTHLTHVSTPSFQSNIAASPAAMFLSAFSSSLPPTSLPDDEGQVVAGYTLGTIIGHGASSVIRKAFSASGGVVAVKIVRRSDIQKKENSERARRELQHEAEVWSSLSHEHIIPLFAAVHTSYADFFVTLYCPAGSMYDILQRGGNPALPQDDAGMMFRQVVRGLRYLHEVALYVHRDIKLENVLVDEMGVCKIGDFGMSRKIGEIDEDDLEVVEDTFEQSLHPGNFAMHRAATISTPSARRQGRLSLQPSSCVARRNGLRHRNSTTSAPTTQTAHVFQPGSLPYASPEILLPQTDGPLRPDPAQDIWALGVLLYALLTGHFPFCDSFEPRLQMKILHGTFELPSGIGKGAERVLLGCIERNVQQRWTIAMVDEVAWGIGWGNEGDDITQTESEEEEFERCRTVTRPPSRSCSRPPLVITTQSPETPQEEARTRTALEAATRRSASRAQRSHSRAPMSKPPSYSGRSQSRGVSHHNSRAPSPSPSTSFLSSNDSPFLASPTFSGSLDRGRRLSRQHRLLPSRSPSPSIAPGTPTDFGMSFSAPLPVLTDEPEELRLDNVEEEEGKERNKALRGITSPPLSSFMSGDSDNSINSAGVGHQGLDSDRGRRGREMMPTVCDKDYYVIRSRSSDKERSQSLGFGLRNTSSPKTSYQHRARGDYVHFKRIDKRTGSTPPAPATPKTPWPTSMDRSISAQLKKEFEFLKPEDQFSDKAGMDIMRSRSVDRGMSWR